ncbi:hypothetical protein K2224_14735 [Streptomyces sp. BHT-5-2]|uniref:hypothetical protein n=1 Tax=Streptomyces sp. BHT-5-2 TaxID=2866715 RepID=UPI001C8F1544|nr:hypothetical protein [Streptomyces sp. BHT-5-2]QZL07125.1 hypothetical protein K2224_14735 [Streptomyces sp. BHT-5-2]
MPRPRSTWSAGESWREDAPQGRYTLTVVSHHGRQTTKQHVTVVGAPVGHGPSWTVPGAVAAARTAGGVIAVRRRSRTTAWFE